MRSHCSSIFGAIRSCEGQSSSLTSLGDEAQSTNAEHVS
jgi:hypothetical protein